MSKWEPISKVELIEEIRKTEDQLYSEHLNFWDVIKINPEKWSEQEYGTEGGGFWVVAICDKRIIWYNDIEEGFNISSYQKYGVIQDYYCNQDELNHAVLRLYDLINLGDNLLSQACS